MPLYTEHDAQQALEELRAGRRSTSARTLWPGVEARFLRAGHILGAAMIELNATAPRSCSPAIWAGRTIPPCLRPKPVQEADYLLVESTYGNRKHNSHSPEDMLAEAIGRTAGRGGTIVIPSFAVGRAQMLLVYLHRLKKARRIPDLPIFLDSPMAINATNIFAAHPDDHKMSAGRNRSRLRRRPICAHPRRIQGA